MVILVCFIRQVNGFGCTLSSSERVRRPSRRVEVSPPGTPDKAQRHFNFHSRHFGSCSLPVSSPSHRNCSLLGRSLGSHQRHVLSEALQRAPTDASTPAADGSVRFWSDASFRQRGYESSWNESAFQHSEGMLVAPQFRDGLPWMSTRQKLLRLNTYPPSGNIMEMDAVGRAGAELQQIQANNISTM